MADKDFVVKNGLVVNTNLLFANNGKVGINNSTPDAALTVTGAANVSSDFHAGGNVGAVSGVFTGSVNVGSISINTTGLVSGNVVTNTNFLTIVGNTTVATLSLSNGGITAGNSSVVSTPVIRLTNASSDANLTSRGLTAGIMVANSTTVGIGSNVYFTATGVYVGNDTVNVALITTSSITPLTVAGGIAASGNVGAVSGVFSSSMNVGSASVSGLGFRQGNLVANGSAVTITGNSSVSTMSLTTNALAIGNSTVTDAPLLQVTNSTTTTNLTSVGLRSGITTVNASHVAVGSNVFMNSSVLAVGNSTANVVIGTNTVYSISVNGNTYISANLKVDGSFTVTGTTTFAGTQLSSGDIVPSSGDSFLVGNSSSRWLGVWTTYVDLPNIGYVNLGNSSVNVYATPTQLRIANSTASATTNLSSGFTVSNSTNILTSLNSTAVAVGANVYMNSSATFVGNTSVNSIQSAAAITLNGNSTSQATLNSTVYTATAYIANNATNLGGTAAASYVQNTESRTLSGNLFFTGSNNSFLSAVFVGSNVAVNTSVYFVGNTSANAFVNSTSFNLTNSTSNVVLNPVSLTIANSTVNTVVNTTAFTIGNSTVFSSINSTFANVQSLSVANNLSVGGNASISGNLLVSGNLTVSGANITLNAATLDVTDLNITVAKGSANSLLADGGGITVEGAAATWIYKDDTNAWQSNKRIMPSASTLDLGNSTVSWNNVYTTRLFGTLQTTSQPNITANNSTNFAGQGQSYYANVTTPVFATSVNVAAINATSNGVSITPTAITIGNSSVNSFVNSTSAVFGNTAANATNITPTSIVIGNSSVSATVNSTTFTGTASAATNASQLGGKTEGNLNVNSAVSATNASQLGGKIEGNLNVNSATYATQLNSKTENNLNVNSALFANSSNYLGTRTASDFANTVNPTFSTSINVASAFLINATGIIGTTGYVNVGTVNTTSLAVYSNGAALLPVGNTTQRPTGVTGLLRYNSDLLNYETYNGTSWVAVGPTSSAGGYYKGGSATVGDASRANNIFRVNANTMSFDTTIATGENAQATGPLTVATGKTLTIQTGARVAII